LPGLRDPRGVAVAPARLGVTRWRVEALPPNWAQLREIVLTRARGMCQYGGCNARATDVDHVKPASEGGTNSLDNLQALCQRHHRRKTGREGQRARTYHSNRRPPDAHPLYG
jgi:5-methylcytosine-specific restriction protein A